jgi:hypothetical protein
MSQYVNTDGGRAAAGKQECKDCTVRALSLAGDISYTDAHRLLEMLGRQARKGFYFVKVARHFDLKHHVQPARGEGRMKVFSAIRKYKTGRFVFRVDEHVFAVVNGTIYDSLPLGELLHRIVTHVWEIDL